MDRATLATYDKDAVAYAQDWHDQPPPTDLHDIVRKFFRAGSTADIGCGSGREVAWLTQNGYPAVGYDASKGLLAEASRRYPVLNFQFAALPGLSGIDTAFDNVLCETVIMHLPMTEITPAVRRLVEIVKPGGTLYLSWRVTRDADQRDKVERLYSAFDAELVHEPLAGMRVLLDEEVVSASSGKIIHRIVARR